MEEWHIRSSGPPHVLIGGDDFKRANKNWERQKKELNAHEERQGPAKGEILTDLGHGRHRKTLIQWYHLTSLALQVTHFLVFEKAIIEEEYEFS